MVVSFPEGYAVSWKCLIVQFLEFSRPEVSLSELSNISLSPETAGTGNNAVKESSDTAFLQNLLQICIKTSLLFLIKLASYYAEIFYVLAEELQLNDVMTHYGSMQQH